MLEDKRNNLASSDLNKQYKEISVKDTNTTKEKSHAAAKQAGKALEAGFAEVKTPSQASDVLDRIDNAAGDTKEQDLAPAQGSVNPIKQAEALNDAAAAASPKERAAVVLTEAAAQIAASPPKSRETLDEAVAAASGEASSKEESPQVERGRDLLRKELISRLKPFDAIDAALFIRVNHLPHPKWLDGLMARFSWMMTGGHAWILVVLVDAFCNRRRATKTALAVLPALYLATYTVEIPIKKYFRRRRPFISIVRAIVVGRKPGSHSFPSGHSAAAFGGATLLQTCYPRGRRLLFAIALLVAFSRVYLGAHYPGDVISGGLAGTALAKLYRSLLTSLK